MVNRVVPRADLDEHVEVLARQVAEAPLSTLMATKAGVKRAWEMMGMRVHLQMSVQMMELVGHAGDVAAWRQDTADRYRGGPRQIAAARFEAAATMARGPASVRTHPDELLGERTTRRPAMPLSQAPTAWIL